LRLPSRKSVENETTSMCSSYLLAHAERAAAQTYDNKKRIVDLNRNSKWCYKEQAREPSL